MSDSYGRKPVYLISLVIFIMGAIVSTFSNSVGALIVLRAFMAFGGGAGQTLGAGVIADTFRVSERGKAYGLFNVGPLCGPIIGPTIGGALCEFLGWRSTLYFLAILGGLLLIAELFLLPETLRLKKPGNDSEKENNKRFRALKNFKAVFAPMVVMLGDPTVLIITAYNTIVFSCMFFVVGGCSFKLIHLFAQLTLLDRTQLLPIFSKRYTTTTLGKSASAISLWALV